MQIQFNFNGGNSKPISTLQHFLLLSSNLSLSLIETTQSSNAQTPSTWIATRKASCKNLPARTSIGSDLMSCGSDSQQGSGIETWKKYYRLKLGILLGISTIFSLFSQSSMGSTVGDDKEETREAFVHAGALESDSLAHVSDTSLLQMPQRSPAPLAIVLVSDRNKTEPRD